jgi:uncharacterized caspase-like protein
MPVKNPNHEAIVVGINDYDDENITSLQGCVNDAKLFRDWLVDADGGGLDSAKITMVVSPSPRATPLRPIKDEIQDVIIRLIRRHSETGGRLGDRLYLWFSGHGITPSRDEDECAILMANAQLMALGRSFPGRFAARDLCFRAMFGEVVLFMDCCRTVSGLERATVDYSASGNPLGANGVKYLQAFATSSTTASSERMLPHPLNSGGGPLMQGIFTHALLDGLKNGVNLDGRVDSNSLARYVKERAQQLMSVEDNQRPDFRFEEGEIIDFGKRPLTQVEVSLSNPADGFQVRFGLAVSSMIHQTPASPIAKANLQLAPARYLFATPGFGNAFQKVVLVDVLGDLVRVNL